MFKKADIILAAVLIILGFAISSFLSLGQNQGNELEVKVDGKKYGSYLLSEDREIKIKNNSHINKITIKSGKVSMSFSDCKNQDCVKHSKIAQTGQTIVCLPNKVVLEIQGNDTKLDSISK